MKNIFNKTKIQLYNAKSDITHRVRIGLEMSPQYFIRHSNRFPNIYGDMNFENFISKRITHEDIRSEIDDRYKFVYLYYDFFFFRNKENRKFINNVIKSQFVDFFKNNNCTDFQINTSYLHYFRIISTSREHEFEDEVEEARQYFRNFLKTNINNPHIASIEKFFLVFLLNDPKSYYMLEGLKYDFESIYLYANLLDINQ
jgi:hypothetical protein